MKNISYSLIAAALVGLIAGCGNNEPDQGNASEASPPSIIEIEASAPRVDQNLVELLKRPNGQEPLAMSAGQTVSGQFGSPQAGKIVAVSVFIGNYINTADGDLSVEICQTNRCESGKSSLSSSQDNAYLEVTLAEGLQVANKPVTYSLSKVGGARVVAIWTYPSTSSLSPIKAADGSILQRTPKIALRYSN